MIACNAEQLGMTGCSARAISRLLELKSLQWPLYGSISQNVAFLHSSFFSDAEQVSPVSKTGGAINLTLNKSMVFDINGGATSRLFG